MRTPKGTKPVCAAVVLSVIVFGCSIRRFAVNKAGDALASGGSTHESDDDVLYWNAVALGLAISVSKSDAGMIARLPEVDALIARALLPYLFARY